VRFLGRLVLVGAVLLVACSKDSKPIDDSDSSTSAAGSASLTVVGDPGLDGPVGTPEVTCQFPDVDGLRIAVLAQAPDSTVIYRIAIGPDTVKVLVNTGGGSEFHERTFQGTGVSQFDARKGARVDAQLTEAATAGADPGSLGALRSIKGSVDCGSQTPGSSTITLTGDTASGRFDGAKLDPALVECYFTAGEVIVLGVAQAGTTKVSVLVSITTQGLSLEEELKPSGQRRYAAAALAGVTITANGGRADGDVVEQSATPPHTVHIQGDAVCGTPIRG
jgi:hypothetical protein